MNILKLGFIETKSDWCHTPRWNMKLKSITQIEGCIIHRELQVVNEVCGHLYQNTEWPSLISHSFQWYQYFLCLLPFLFFSSPFIFIYPLHSTITLEDFCKRRHLKEHVLDSHIKGTYCHNRQSSTSWMAEYSDKSLSLFWRVMKQTEHSKPLVYLVAYRRSKMHYNISVVFFSEKDFLWASLIKGHFSKGKTSVLLSNYSKCIYRS